MAISGHLARCAPLDPPHSSTARASRIPFLIRFRPIPRRHLPRRRVAGVRSDAAIPLDRSLSSLPSTSDKVTVLVGQPGGKMVAELVGVFNELTERMGTTALSTCSTQLLFRSLTLSIPLLRRMPVGPDGRTPLSRALAIACTLADLQVYFPVFIPSHLLFYTDFSDSSTD
ncbi:unnamed protein product [Spirodela intermedia]|uniref:Uncharacterized protein n=1 Tax=Spirodela intermedia TaxID=51605 RepID=A0A7I8J2J7_SPIIN|nr:unnamed protein product [Spirodela intermedia]CAA6663611.1 unnamed protein product [Spirodela intermedia]